MNIFVIFPEHAIKLYHCITVSFHGTLQLPLGPAPLSCLGCNGRSCNLNLKILVEQQIGLLQYNLIKLHDFLLYGSFFEETFIYIYINPDLTKPNPGVEP